MKIALIILISALVLGAVWYFIGPLFIDNKVDETFPEVEISENSALPIEQSKEIEIIASGEFRGSDKFHRGSGTVMVVGIANDLRLVRFENFEVTNGPDLHVLLVNHPNPLTRDDVKQASYIDLGKLKGNIGNQNYEVPVGANFENASIVIYCQPFHVIFSTASLTVR